MKGLAEAPGDGWADCMRAQDFAGAWRIGDRSLAARDMRGRDDPSLPYHKRWVWDGTPPDGRDVLVRCYHGLGDTLQFARFLPRLRARAAHLTVEAQRALCPLLSSLPGINPVPFDTAAPLPPVECTLEIMETAHMLRAEAADIAACVPYLRSPAGPSPTGDVIGLCWQAGDWDADRSIGLSPLQAACTAPGRRFVSLQRGPAAPEAAGDAFLNPGEQSLDIARTALLIVGTRCVVTVDTMVAHLAGALGHPVLLLLKAQPDWRWASAGKRTAWYPRTTILRQLVPGEWNGVLSDLARALATGAAG